MSARLAKQGSFRQHPAVSMHAGLTPPVQVLHMELFCWRKNDGAWGHEDQGVDHCDEQRVIISIAM